eukprot:UN09412
MLNFILPSQPNNLEILKFENSYFMITDHPECNDSNDEFRNIERIKTSLSNLKGFVYHSSKYDNDENQYFNLARIVL